MDFETEDTTFRTADGATVRVGDRVYNYYDCEWGKIAGHGPFQREGWFSFVSDAGASRILNGERITIRKPVR